MTAPVIQDLEQHCTRCNHQNACHIGTDKNRWGWPIYSQLWLDASGWCTTPGCGCKQRSNDPAAAPADPVTFTRPAPHPVLPCNFWDAAAQLVCETSPARLYECGWRCGSHTPAAVAGLPEASAGGCAPLRHYCETDSRCATWAWQQQPWRLLITGGRDRTDKARIWSECDLVLAIHPVLTLIHGDARPRPENGVRPDKSADWLAHLWCETRGVKEEAHPADWKTYGRGAGIRRNADMVKLGADECVAFPGAGNGTRDCMARASAAGIPVRPIWPHTPAVTHA